MATRRLFNAPLPLAQELRGAELSSPLRRLAAMAADMALIFVPSIAPAVGAARVTPHESGARFAGYLHIPGSFGPAFLDLWRDPCRRMPHDRVASTAVIRSRRPAHAARTAQR